MLGRVDKLEGHYPKEAFDHGACDGTCQDSYALETYWDLSMIAARLVFGHLGPEGCFFRQGMDDLHLLPGGYLACANLAGGRRMG